MYRNLYDFCLACAVILFVVFVFSTAVSLATAPPRVCVDGGTLPAGVATGHIAGAPYWRCGHSANHGFGGVCSNDADGKPCDNADPLCECKTKRKLNGNGDCKCE